MEVVDNSQTSPLTKNSSIVALVEPQEVTFPIGYIKNLETMFAVLKNFIEPIYSLNQNSPKTYLEFGCGKFGGYFHCWKQYFLDRYVLDIFDYAETVGKEAKFLLSADSRTIPLPDYSVDFIASHSVLEHVIDLSHTLGEMHRILKIGGVAYLTVSPLFFNRRGGHIAGHNNWEHLDPDSKWFMGARVPGDSLTVNYLNGLTTSRFLSAIGQYSFRAIAYDIRVEQGIPLPEFLRESPISRHDLFTREFRIVVQKVAHFVDDEVLLRPRECTAITRRGSQ